MSTVEWIFSGVGASVIAVIIERLISKKVKDKSVRNNISDLNLSNSSNNTFQIIEHQEQHLYQAKQESAETVILTDISPNQIKATIEKAPLYQQSQTAKNFIGLNVVWKLKLFSISSEEKSITVTFIDQGLYPDIIIQIDVETYPYFKIASKDEIFEIAGKIIDCQVLKIFLDIRYIRELK